MAEAGSWSAPPFHHMSRDPLIFWAAAGLVPAHRFPGPPGSSGPPRTDLEGGGYDPVHPDCPLLVIMGAATLGQEEGRPHWANWGD